MWTRASMILIGCLLAGAPIVEAHACTRCAVSQLWSLDEEGLSPGNAGVRARNVPLESIVASVDGAPASVSFAPWFFPTDPADVLVVLDTPAPPGAEVRVEVPEPAICFGQRPGPISVELTAGPPDEVAPVAAAALQWDLHTYERPDRYSCGVERGQMYLQFEAPPAAEGAAAHLADVVWSDGGEVVWRGFTSLAPGETTHAITYPIDTLAFADRVLVELCVQVTIVDAAGNVASTAAQACGPCHYLDDGDVAEAPPTPKWGPANEFPPGQCAAASPEDPPPPDDDPPSQGDGSDGPADSGGTTSLGTTGEDPGATGDVVDRGCACAAGPDSTGPWGWCIGLIVAFRARRRPGHAPL